jgi:hypothetical protein
MACEACIMWPVTATHRWTEDVMAESGAGHGWTYHVSTPLTVSLVRRCTDLDLNNC